MIDFFFLSRQNAHHRHITPSPYSQIRNNSSLPSPHNPFWLSSAQHQPRKKHTHTQICGACFCVRETTIPYKTVAETIFVTRKAITSSRTLSVHWLCGCEVPHAHRSETTESFFEQKSPTIFHDGSTLQPETRCRRPTAPTTARAYIPHQRRNRFLSFPRVSSSTVIAKERRRWQSRKTKDMETALSLREV